MRIDIEGIGLWVEVRGDGTPVVFIHGFPHDHTLWRNQLAALNPWMRVAPDLRGAGRSDVPPAIDTYSMARYADDVVAILDTLKIRAAVVCGLSMGGYILFEVLRRHAARVRAAVFCNTKAEADSAEAKSGRDAMAALAREEGSGAVAEKLLPKMVSQPRVAAEVRAMMAAVPVSGIVGALRAMRERADHTGTLETIRVPTLVIAGKDDQIIPSAGMLRMAEAIRGARFEMISAAGHLTPLEQPGAFNQVLTNFLQKVG
jgi:pimeloyl-ACP methyl ester carboxylesterase